MISSASSACLMNSISSTALSVVIYGVTVCTTVVSLTVVVLILVLLWRSSFKRVLKSSRGRSRRSRAIANNDSFSASGAAAEAIRLASIASIALSSCSIRERWFILHPPFVLAAFPARGIATALPHPRCAAILSLFRGCSGHQQSARARRGAARPGGCPPVRRAWRAAPLASERLHPPAQARDRHTQAKSVDDGRKLRWRQFAAARR